MAILQIHKSQILEEERNAKLYSLFLTGSYSQSSLARMFKISRERVRQIIKRAKNTAQEI